MSSEQELKEWAQLPVTREFRDKLKLDRAELMEAWARGQFTNITADGTIQKNSEAIGQVIAIDQIVEYIEALMETP